ncbi:MAG: hypothetical protein L7F77_12595 [Candidatus Magnetominusculus sp. LBB02]|nr:hypothetical protein [Candidatus Magnetominusculus sp. LBB02]
MKIKYNQSIKQPERFIYPVIAIYFALTLFNILHHIMWSDELIPWAIAKASSSFSQMCYNYLYEGHPRLWVSIVYVLAKITNSMVSMQIAHLFIATAAAFVFLKYAPFSKWQRILFIFGYFISFEYAVISRNYAIGFVMIFAVCYMIRPKQGRRNYLLIAAALSLMCQGHALSCVIAIAFALTIGFDFLVLDKDTKNDWLMFIVAAVIFALGLALTLYQIKPPSDSLYLTEYKHEFPSGDILHDIMAVSIVTSHIAEAFIPIPMLKIHFWETNIFSYISTKDFYVFVIRLFLSIGFLLTGMFMVLRRPVAAFFFIVGGFGLIAFNILIYGYGYIRHTGYFFILLICALWLSYYYEPFSFKSAALNRLFNFFERKRGAFLSFLIATHLIAASVALTLHAKYPFTTAKEAAEFIKTQELDGYPIAADNDWQTATISIYLGKEFYYPVLARSGTYIVSNNKRLLSNNDRALSNHSYYDDKAFILNEIRKFMLTKHSSILVILNYQVPEALVKDYGLLPIKKFKNGIVVYEEHRLFLMVNSDNVTVR